MRQELISSQKPELQNAYPAVFEHLKQWQRELEKRWDKGEHWWELLACDYHGEFTKNKIVFPEIGKEPRFAFDDDGFYANNKVFLIPTDDLFLLGVLNSDAAWSYAKNVCAVLGDENKGGRVMLQWVNFKRTPIPKAPAAERSGISALVKKCL